MRHECRVDPLGVQTEPLSSPTRHMIAPRVSAGSDFSPFPFTAGNLTALLLPVWGRGKGEGGWGWGGQGCVDILDWPLAIVYQAKGILKWARFKAYPAGIYGCAAVVHNRLWVTAHSSKTGSTGSTGHHRAEA